MDGECLRTECIRHRSRAPIGVPLSWANMKYQEGCLLEKIKALPSAEKVGKWIIHPEIKNIYGGTCIECSECREKYVVQHIEDEKFCRNCGARMRGEEEDE